MYEELVKDLRGCSVASCQECRLGNHSGTYVDCMIALMEEAANAIDGLEKSIPRWIPVTEALPELDKRVFVIGLFGFCGIYSLIQVHDTTCWEDEYGYYQDFEDVTHWMPLPEPPKEET